MRSFIQNRSGFLCGCAAIAATLLAVGAPTPLAAEEPLRVAATLEMIGQWVKAVGQDEIVLTSLSPSGSDPHTFEPTARAMNAARTADVVFALGLGLEPWLERIASSDSSLNVTHIAPTGGLLAIAGGAHSGCGHNHAAHSSHSHGAHAEQGAAHADHSDHGGGHQHGQSEAGGQANSKANAQDAHAHAHCNHAAHNAGTQTGSTQQKQENDTGEAHRHTHGDHAHHDHNHAHGEDDPHVWMDPLLVKQMVTVIAQKLSAARPHKADVFNQNAAAYIARLESLDSEIRQTLASVPPERRKLVTNHDNLRYFARRYDFSVADTLFGVQGAEGGQPSARKVRELVGQLRQQRIAAVFADAFTNQGLLETVAKEAGIGRPVLLYPLVGAANSPAPDYESMMRFNARQIAKALGKDS